MHLPYISVHKFDNFYIYHICWKKLKGYWVSAIAARPSSTHKGYLLGGLVWFAVPFSLATSLGLGALALDLPLTESEASHGLVPPATAIALMGKGGSVLLLTMLFM